MPRWLALIVEAPTSLEALRTALEVHADAVLVNLRSLGAGPHRGHDLVRVGAQLGRGAGGATRRAPAGLGADPTFVARIYQTGRSMLRATTLAEVTAVLTHFIEVTGGWVVESEGPSPWILPTDISLGRGAADVRRRRTVQHGPPPASRIAELMLAGRRGR
ncbi:MAG: hypothetical protein ACRD2W_03745 [Acidimicrobiales bacterium]